MTRVLVVGGGLSGLVVAHALQAAEVDVQVLEAADRAGGVAGTETVSGFRFERGPNTLQASAVAFRELCGELDLAERLIVSDPDAKLRYIHYRGKLQALPATPPALLTTSLLPLGARSKLFGEFFRKSPWARDVEPEPSLAEFLEERLGERPTRLFAAAFVRGIYAGDIDRLGARSAFPRLWNMTAEHGGILRGLVKRRAPADLPGPKVAGSRLLSFPGGLQELVDALTSSLGDRLHLGLAADGLRREERGWSVATSAGRLLGDAVVLAAPAPAAARLLATLEPAPRELDALRAAESASVTVVHLGFDAEHCRVFAELGGFPPGFGYLVPPGQHSHSLPTALGTIFASNLFEARAPQGGLALTSFYASHTLEGMEPHTIVRTAEKDLARALRLGELPHSSANLVLPWPDAIPQYTVGYARRMSALVDELRDNHPGLELAGNFVGGVGVEQVIARAREVAARLSETR